jgi:hypothetical protein
MFLMGKNKDTRKGRFGRGRGKITRIECQNGIKYFGIQKELNFNRNNSKRLDKNKKNKKNQFNEILFAICDKKFFQQ